MIAEHIYWILIVTGLVTVLVLPMVFAPAPMLRLLFGEVPVGPLAVLIARHWGLLLGLLGLLLLSAAYVQELRTAVVTFAMLEKFAFALLVLPNPQLRSRGRAGLVAATDLLTAVVFLLYLAGI